MGVCMSKVDGGGDKEGKVGLGGDEFVSLITRDLFSNESINAAYVLDPVPRRGRRDRACVLSRSGVLRAPATLGSWAYTSMGIRSGTTLFVGPLSDDLPPRSRAREHIAIPQSQPVGHENCAGG